MNLLQMSFTGGVLILVVIVLRAMTLNRLPKGTFLALWAVAVLRLLTPFSIPSPVSVYTLADSQPLRMADSAPAVPAAFTQLPAASAVPSIPEAVSNAAPSAAPAGGETVQIWPWVWLAGAVMCGAFFLLSYLRCRREFRTALPVTDERLQIWLAALPLRRTVSIRQSDRIHAPLTYGLLRPVVLLPKNWKDEPQLDYVLEHELAHIRYLDALWKPLLALAACVHWFNPLVWCMFVLANRDMELRCDEAVVRLMGLDSRSGYALTLISLEEKKSGLGPFASAFSKNAVEERIRAIMKIRKRSLAAVIAAALLVCCIAAGFATSAPKENSDPPIPAWSDIMKDRLAYAQKQGQAVLRITDAMDELLPELTKDEKLWIADQYILGYSDLTVTEYRQKVQMKWNHNGETNGTAVDDYVEAQSDTDHPAVTLSGFQPDFGGLPANSENWSALDRYVELRADTYHPADALSDFDEYFFNVFLPLMKDGWEAGHDFSGEASTSLGRLEYNYSVEVTDPDTLTVGEYQRMQQSVGPGVQNALNDLTPSGEEMTQDELDAAMKALFDQFNSIEGVQVHVTANGYLYLTFDDPDVALHAQFSRETAAQWHELLSPYAPFGLTWEFDDPDLDGNGLTMWFEGKEVRGICDERKGLWITEHAGTGFSDGAVELYTVYTDGVLTGLRPATIEEQAGFDEERQKNARDLITLGLATLAAEQREFPQATREDYDALLTLRQVDNTNLPPWASYPYRDYQDESLESFNRRLLDWANENPGVYDRINCDVIWNDYGVELTADEQIFVSLTCALSGTENGMMIRALHTGRPEEDPSFSGSMPEQSRISEYSEKCVTDWCDLYYNISYHIADKSAVTVAERDACVGGMMNAINAFWQDTDFEILLQMTEEEVAAQFNLWAEENSTEGVRINPVTADDIFFEHSAEGSID